MLKHTADDCFRAERNVDDGHAMLAKYQGGLRFHGNR
jgi:hypothetical protein